MERVEAGRPRVKFEPERVGAPGALPPEAAALSRALAWMADEGLSPRLEDGGLAGNGAIRAADGTLWVSPSGRGGGAIAPEALVQVVSFDPERWHARYRSLDPDARPTSDTPLHWAMLVELALPAGWDACASLHGHVLSTDEDAARAGVPISREATEFSTPADRAALLELAAAFPYPTDDAWIRRGHGVFVIGPDVRAAQHRLDALARR
jgi:ribulose-5-phosphate 4-epimerase/fuculose-1-phosphate aldolase